MIDKCIKQILNNMPFPIWIRGLDKEIKYTNYELDKLHNASLGNKGNLYKKVCNRCSSKKICFGTIDKVIENKKSLEFEIYFSDKITKCYVNPFLNENQELIGVIGTLIDITNRKEEQRQLEEREHILRTIIDTIPGFIFYKDRDCRYIGYNKKWKDYYNSLGIKSMIGKNDFESNALSNEVAQKFVEEDKEIMRTKKIKVSERKIVDSLGNHRIEETTKVPVISEDGQVWGIVGLSSDVTEKIELKEKLIRLSYTDSLTGVYNRACFEEKKEELNKEKHLPIGVVMGDVNGLKVVNDTFGHLEGARLLIEMSISLGSSIKTSLNGDIYENLKEAEEKLYRQKFLQEKSIRSSIIFSLRQSLHEKNVETQAHTQRLVRYAIEIGKKLGFTTDQLNELELVTKLHDIGKIGVSEDILLKKEALNEEEFKEMKTHTEKGYRILQASNELTHVARGVLTHHERYDGKGYPLGLKVEEIPLMARIENIVDSYDAMIINRGYNQVKAKHNAIAEIKRCKGRQFDPHI